MMLGLGVGGIAIGIFHLFNHAFFKALLFLGAGSVSHATGTFDMRKMGGLRKIMPWTYATFLIASLSIAGIWPLAGFWSKDEILASALENQPVLFYLAMITVFMTAFYMFRVVFMTFGGSYRGGDPEAHGKPHESPPVMVMPMVVLAILAVVSGLWNVTGDYSARWLSAERIGGVFQPLYNLFLNKYWLDELYEKVFVGKVLLKGFFAGLQGFDVYGVDGAVNGVASGAMATGRAIRKAHSGQLQLYGLFIGIGIIVIVACFYIFG
jgi:NADH-quinone oxidoreductase subunit L